MDSRTRQAALARDGAVARINSVTRRISAASFAGALVLAAGFAHLLPTHLPHIGASQNGGNGGTSSGSGGLQAPGTGPGSGSGPGHVSSGGS
jgi:hypothetical protein